MSQAVRRIAAGADGENIDAWWRRVADDILALVAAGFEVARRLAERFLTEHAEIEGRTIDPVLAEWDGERAATSLRVTGPVAFKEHIRAGGTPATGRAAMVTQLAGSAERLVLAGERETVSATVEDSEDIVGWRRVGDGDPCAWCAMLISRGAVYKTKASAGGVVGRGGVPRGSRVLGVEYHDHDGCTAEPVYEHEEEPAEVDELYEQWKEVTSGKSGNDALNAWRQYWEGREPTGTSRKPASAAPARPRDVAADAEASQRRADRAALTGGAAAEVEEAVHAGADLETARGYVDAITGRALDGGASADIEDAVVRMRTIAAEAESPGELVKALWSLTWDSGGRRIGHIGERVRFDPRLHDLTDGETSTNAEIVWPGVRTADGRVLQKAVVNPAAESDDDIRERIAARADLPLLARLIPFTDDEGQMRDDEVFDALRDALDGDYAGLSVQVTEAEATGNAVDVVAKILDAAGKPVGTVQRQFQRTFDAAGAEVLWAYHDILQLVPDVQGQGFAAAWNARLEELYRQAGFSHIKLLANIDVGGYAWARQGFDFADEPGAQNIALRLGWAIEAARSAGTLSADDLKEGQEMVERLNLPLDSPRFPTPFEVSRLGRHPGQGRGDSWLGKQALLGSSWYGVRWLR